jgi:hypothetical protein
VLSRLTHNLARSSSMSFSSSSQPTTHFVQAEHKLLSVPGPVEVSDEVLFAVRALLTAPASLPWSEACVLLTLPPTLASPSLRNLRTRAFRRTIVLIPRGPDHAWTTALDRIVPGTLNFRAPSLSQNAHPSMSHVSPAFAPVFGDCLRYLRKLLYTEKGQPFIIAGSGTLGWDLVAANCASADPFVSFALGRRGAKS